MANSTISSFTAGDLVISISGNGDGSGPYTDNQATPITLQELTTSGTVVGQMVLPQVTTTVNGVTQSVISGEYGSSSEGVLQLSANGQSLTIAGYGVNAATYNAGESNGNNVYGNAALAQSTSVTGGAYTAVPRVVADISANGTVDTSTSLYNIYNTQNPRSVATTDGSVFYLSGQGVKGSTNQGVFTAADGSSTATPIYTGIDTRTAEIYNGTLYVSSDSSQAKGTGTISSYGGLPTGTTTPTPLPGMTGKITLTAAQTNSVNSSSVGTTVDLSPEQFYFANSSTLYVADSGNPKGGTVGDGGLQKWNFNGTSWNLQYTLSSGLNLVANSATAGSTGLIGLTGKTDATTGTVTLYATNATVGDLDPTAVYSITDSLTATSPQNGESFSTLVTAAPDTNIRGIAFAPSIAPACYMSGTLIATTRGEVAVEDLAIGDEVVTAAGARRPIRWIGHRAYLPRFANANPALLPILFAAGSLGDGLPRRDLLVSPKHAMFIDGVLVPAECLVDGRGIRKLDHVETLTYWHIELDSHDVLLAEGTPSESFVDDNSRNLFHNAQSYRDANPDAVATEAVYCAPRVEDGFALAAIRAGIAERAGLAAPATSGGAFEGAFAVEGGMVKGWARNALFPAAAVCLDIVVDGTVVAQTLADRFQAAVGAHGFAVALPATAGTVTVRRSLDGAALEAETRVAAAA